MKVALKHAEIIHQTDDYVVVNKPPGILSIPDRFDPNKANLLDWLRSKYDNVLTVHRLDKGTSGVILYALNPEAHAMLSSQFEDRQVDKTYLALVLGHPPGEGLIDTPIVANKNRPGTMRTAKKGKPSITHFKVLEQFRNCALIEVKPETGRTHQIRVHMKSIGFPLLIDPIYGLAEGVFLSRIKPKYRQKAFSEERPLMDRLSLHASKLEFTEPVTEKKVSFEADLPKDFRVVVQNLEKYQLSE